MKQVASVAVCDNQGRILMGKRKDTGGWTLPGGHIEPNETVHDGALRELFEEAGVEAAGLTHLRSKVVTTKRGELILVHAYQLAAEPFKTTSKFDPDEEVDKWEWIDYSTGLPDKVRDSLHNKRDVVLEELGIVEKPDMLYIDMTIKGREIEHYISKGVRPADRQGPHKYLRKYMGRNGQWIYMYHEGENPGRPMAEDAVNHLHSLANEHAHPHAKALIATLQEHHPEKIAMLRKLATEHNHEPAKKHLDQLGIPHSDKKLEDRILPAKTAFQQELPADQAKDARKRLFEGAHGATHSYLEGHRDSPFTTKLQEHDVKSEHLKEALEGHNNLQGMIQAVHDHMKRMDTAHEGLGTPRNSSASEAGGYGSLGFQSAVKKLQEGDHISEAHGRKLALKRTPQEGIDFDWLGESGEHKEHQAQAEGRMRERAAEEERKRKADERAREELRGSMAEHVASFVNGGMSTAEQIKLQKFFNKAFKNRDDGQTLRKEDWPYDFSQHGVKVKIDQIQWLGDGSVKFYMAAYKGGSKITETWDRQWSILPDGGAEIYNAYLEVKPSMRNTVKMGAMINNAQVKLLKAYSPKGQVRVTASLGVGGYNWSNQGFSFSSDSERNDYVADFAQWLKQKHGVNLSREDMKKFKQPCHISSFDVGIYVERNINGRTEKVHLGKEFLLGKQWRGTYKVSEMNDDNPAHKFFQNYAQMRRETWKVLEPEYKEIISRERESRGMSPDAQGSQGSRSGSSGTRTIGRLPSGYRDWDADRLRAYARENQESLSTTQRVNLQRAFDAVNRRRAA